MKSTELLFQQPSFKERVVCKFQDAGVEIRDRDRGCFITVSSEDRQEFARLLKLLQTGGMSSEQLAQACPQFREQIDELLIEFDRRGLLAKPQSYETSSVITGRQFYQELTRFLDRLKSQFPPSSFLQQMARGNIDLNQMLGYVLESYHVTHLCPRLLAPCLANYESATTQKLLQDFFVSELHHDRLMENSLTSLGIKEEQIKQMQPLPMTFAVCSTLGVFARQDPLSFKAALILFEEDDEKFHELFQQQCQALKLPAEFYQPILLHARINEEGAHDRLTEMLLAEVPYVTTEEQLVVKKNMAVLMESMVLRTHEILDYYGNDNNIIPRCF